jgi:ERCC4-type nuclease
MFIKVDSRETELIKYIKGYLEREPFLNAGLQLIVENLPLGDVIIMKDEEELIIIERKTVNDLVASIKDGRYEEQSYRLQGSKCHNHCIIYLIEGDVRYHKEKQTIYSAMCSIHYYKGFSTMRSFSIDETAYMICNMVYKINKNNNRIGYYCMNQLTKIENNENEGKTHENNYSAVVKKVKKENVNAENIGEIMLSQIPGVSFHIAKAIFSEFKTMPKLIQSIQERDNCLDHIGTIDSKNKFRKISKTTKENIIKFLKDN